MRTVKPRRASTYVWKLMHLNRSRMVIFLTLFVLAVMLFIINVRPYASLGLVMLPVSYLLGLYAYRNYILWSSGREGELTVLDELNKLGDEYVVIRNAVIPPNRGDTDYIVVGPNGVFIVETKNTGGIVQCDGDVWTRHKVGRRGKPYRLEIGNPSRQAKRSAKSLKDFILSRRSDVFKGETPHLWVCSILVFTNRDVRLNLRKPTVEVVEVGKLNEFILRQKSMRLSKASVDGIAHALARYV